MAHPWPAGATTGVGSLPFADQVEAVKLVLGEVPGLPYLPELPARGLGADMIGRTAAMLIDFPVEALAGGWTLTSAPGRDLARAADFLRRDIDAVIERASEVGLLKVQVCGPMTLAATLELPTFNKVLVDHGAFRDLAESLAEGVAAHVDTLRAHLPGLAVVLQVDEPALPIVLAGRVPTPSGVGPVRALERSIAQPALTRVLEAVPDGYRAVHCCAVDAPFDLIRAAGANAISFDAIAAPGPTQLDALGEAVDAGVALWLGVVPATDTEFSREALTARVRALWNQLGFGVERLASSVVPTPSCGLAGASGGYARTVMRALREVGQELTEQSG